MKCKEFGLIGNPLSHSFSEKYFTSKFNKENLNCRYSNFQLENINQLPGLIQSHPNLLGLNVTIPYKQKVIAFLDELTPEADSIQAVNTIIIGNKLIGHNTDIIGFRQSLTSFDLNGIDKALVLGNGGAAKAVKQALDQLNITHTTISRKKSDTTIVYEDINEKIMQEHLLVINCTPLGTHPHVEAFPSIPYKYITNNHLLYDLVYNPAVSTFLQKGKMQGARTTNGLKMLHIQAEESWKVWQVRN